MDGTRGRLRTRWLDGLRKVQEKRDVTIVQEREKRRCMGKMIVPIIDEQLGEALADRPLSMPLLVV